MLRIGGNTKVNIDSGYDWNPMRLFLEGFVVDSESSDCIEVDCYGGYLHFTQMERFRQLFHFSVFSKDATTVVVVPGSNSAFDIYVNIGSAVSFSEFL